MRSILTYLFLVGIPLAGLIGILRLGEQLEAPRAVAGTWMAVERGSLEAWDAGCRRAAETDDGDLGPSEVRIEQSGARIEISWSAVRAREFHATLRGDSIEGELALQGGHGCPGGELTLSGDVRQVNERDHIVGKLRQKDCASCRPIPVDWRRRR